VTGATIDHMISLTILIAALLVAMMTFNGLFATAVDYDRNRQVANKAVDLINTICLSPGNPADWGKTNDALLGFGLQDPDVGGYALSPYSLMRLNTVSDGNPLVYYGGTDTYYNNISTSYGYGILTPIGDCVNYTTAAELLGINGTYGFSFEITPTLDVSISQVSTEPLTLNVQVSGSGLPLSGATVTSHLFEIDTNDLSITWHPNVTLTDGSGSADIIFNDIDYANPVYSFTAYVSLGGLHGVGHHICNTISDDEFIVPLVEDFENGSLILTHIWEIENPGEPAAVFYNAAFFILTSNFNVQEYDLDCSGHLTFGEGFNYVPTQIPPSEVGLLIVSYKANNEVGSIIVPWGIGALGVSASYNSGLGSGDYDFVATELRQVTIDNISYQVKVSTWKLGS